ncbi:MAG: Gfo/Idh/MocA family oxidoreductase, partial [Acidobacteriota bacterium]
SYGPGRYDPNYEDRGRDYPAPYVRWTEQRNLQAVLRLMESGGLDVAPLISHRFPVEQAADAYELIERGAQDYLGVLLEYPELGGEEARSRASTVTLRAAAGDGAVTIGFVGAGSFAGGVLLPALAAPGVEVRRRVICSAKGLSAVDKGERFGFELATTDEQVVMGDDSVDAVFLATRHDLHAAQVLEALGAGKHVFVEKPLALQVSDILAIDEVVQGAGGGEGAPLVTVGFNRRFAPLTREVREFFADVDAPLTVSVRFNAGTLEGDHWAEDEEVGGGRIVGEACHGIDLATYLVGAEPVRVFCESVGGPHAPSITQDQCFITLRHANGAVSSIAYLAGGDRSLPKERVEVIGGGRVAIIDDFRGLTLVKDGTSRERRLRTQDKGHVAEVRAFLEAVAGRGTAPIPWNELRAVSLAAVYALHSLREGMPVTVSARS